MAVVENPDEHQPFAHVACDFMGGTIPWYQTHESFATHLIAGIWCLTGPAAGCAVALSLSQGRAVIRRGKQIQTTSYQRRYQCQNG
jgi:hypothetical protein